MKTLIMNWHLLWWNDLHPPFSKRRGSWVESLPSHKWSQDIGVVRVLSVLNKYLFWIFSFLISLYLLKNLGICWRTKLIVIWSIFFKLMCKYVQQLTWIVTEFLVSFFFFFWFDCFVFGFYSFLLFFQLNKLLKRIEFNDKWHKKVR